MGPGSLLECLQRLAVPIQSIRIDKGQPVPKDAQEFSGIVLLDSERSALESTQWIRAELSLCKESLTHDVSVLGLGYGAQLLAVAAGGSVAPSTSPSYGWTPSWLTQQAASWFDVPVGLEIFNAYSHALDLPPEAESFLMDKRCKNKGFALGSHMGLLCPLELTPEALLAWCARKGTKMSQAKGPDVQSRISMQRALSERMDKLNLLATREFTRWALQLPGAPHPVDARLAA